MSQIDITLLALAAANFIAFLGFWFDKAQATTGGWRVAERSLLLMTMLGGLGGWMGQHILRHKTRKEPFRTQMGFALGFYAIGLAGVVYLLLR